MSTSARHSSKTDEHLTPLYIVTAAREALGGVINTDPATTARANEDIGASFALARADNGLKAQWGGAVFLNPPGGTIRGCTYTKSKAVVWWAKMMVEWLQYRITSGIFVCFSVEMLQSAQKAKLHVPLPTDFPICFPDHRIPFDTIVDGQRVSQKDPTHANAIIYLPSRDDPAAKRFEMAFSNIGRVIR